MKSLPNQEPVERWEDGIIDKTEKYVRANSIYYGDDRYSMNMKDWLYFVEGVINEALSHQKALSRAEVLEEVKEWAISNSTGVIKETRFILLSDLVTKIDKSLSDTLAVVDEIKNKEVI